jgi:hypothetical protein
MAARPTFAKRDRERARKLKAEEKRDRKLTREAEGPAELPPEGEAIDPGTLLQLVEATQRAFDNEEIDFEEYEERKSELLARLTID